MLVFLLHPPSSRYVCWW